MPGLLLAGLLSSLMLSAPSADAAKKEPTVQERYDKGQKYLKRGYYVKALEEFNRIRNYHRDDPMALKAELAIADVYFKKAEWDQARIAYEDFMRMHPRHEDLDYVVFRLGMTSFKKSPRIAARDQTWTRQAVNAWSGFDNRYPSSDHSTEVADNLQKCRDRLARKEYQIGEFYSNRAAWPAAKARMEQVLRQYPNSDSVPDALALLALSQYNLGEQDAAREAVTRLREDHPDARSLKMLARKAPEL